MIKTRIALPKGRFLQRSLNIIYKYLDCNDIQNFDTRKLSFEANDVIFFLLKVSDICELIFNGSVDMGIVPDEWVLEYELQKKINFKKLKKFEWIRTRISLICSPSEKELSKYDIVSSFPNIALQYLRKKGVSTNVHEMNGSLEATIPIIYPMGIDCIETGETLRQNGLKELEIIYDELGLTMISYKNEHINIKIIKALAI